MPPVRPVHVLALSGHSYSLYFEGEPIEQFGGLAFDSAAPNGLKYYAGKACVARISRPVRRAAFDFRTEALNGPHRLEPRLFLTPASFPALRGQPYADIVALIERDPQSLIDELAAQTLATIDAWEIDEFRRKGDWRYIVSPPTIVFGVLPADLVERGLFGQPTLAFTVD